MKKENKAKIISISLEPDMHDLIKSSAKKMGHKNVSQLIRDLISKYLNLMLNENDEVPILIKVPNSLKNEKLKEWLYKKSDAICEALSK